MKKIITILVISCWTYLLHAQRNIETETGKIARLIERNISISDESNTAKSNEVFIYDITLDSIGKIAYIDLFGMDSSIYTASLRRIIPLIIKNWPPVKSNKTKIVVPVLIVPENYSEERFLATLQTDLNRQNTMTVYISRIAFITVHAAIY